ncbi:VWA domain-containing protein, partial [bacterium]
MRIYGSGRFAALALGLFMAFALAGCCDKILSPNSSSGGGSSGGGGGGGTTTTTTIAAPTPLLPASSSKFYASSVTITWDPSRDSNNALYPVAEVSGYELKLGRDANFTDDMESYKVTDPAAIATTMSYTLNIANAADYAGDWYWKVRAIPVVPTRARNWSSVRHFFVETVTFGIPKGSATNPPSNLFAMVSSTDNLGLPETMIQTTGADIKLTDGAIEVPNGTGTLPAGVGKGRFEEAYYEFIHTPLQQTRTDVVFMLDCSASVVNDPARFTKMITEVSNFYGLIKDQANYNFYTMLAHADGSTPITISTPSTSAAILSNAATLESRVRRYLTLNQSTALWTSMQEGAVLLSELKDRYFTEYILSNTNPNDVSTMDRLREKEWAGALILFTDGEVENASGTTPEDVIGDLALSGSSAYAVVLDYGTASSATIDGLKAIAGKNGVKISGSTVTFATAPVIPAPTALTAIANTTLGITNGVTTIDLDSGASFYGLTGGTTVATDSSGNVGAAAYTASYLNGNRMVFLASESILELAADPNQNMTFARNAVAWAGRKSSLTGLTVAVYPPELVTAPGELDNLIDGLRADSPTMGSANVSPYSASTIENAGVLIVHKPPYLLTSAEVNLIFDWAMTDSQRGIIFSGSNGDLAAAIGDGYFGFDGYTATDDAISLMDGVITFTPDSVTLGGVTTMGSVDGGSRLGMASNGLSAISAWENTADASRRTILVGTGAVLANAGETSPGVANSNGLFANEALDWLSGGTLATLAVAVDDGNNASSVLTGELNGFRVVLSRVSSVAPSEVNSPIDAADLAGKKVLILHSRSSPLSQAEIEAVSNWMYSSGGTLLVSGVVDASTEKLLKGLYVQALSDKVSGGI